jgi:hypothetical protein
MSFHNKNQRSTQVIFEKTPGPMASVDVNNIDVNVEESSGVILQPTEAPPADVVAVEQKTSTDAQIDNQDIVAALDQVSQLTISDNVVERKAPQSSCILNAYSAVIAENEGTFDLENDVDVYIAQSEPYHKRMLLRRGSSMCHMLIDTTTSAEWLRLQQTHPETREVLGVNAQRRAEFKNQCLQIYPHISLQDVTDEFLVGTLRALLAQADDEQKHHQARAFLTCDVLASEVFIPDMNYQQTRKFLYQSVPGTWLLRESSADVGQDSRLLVAARRSVNVIRQTRIICVRGVGVFAMPSDELPLVLSHEELASNNFRFFVCVIDAIEDFMNGGNPKLTWRNLIRK